MTADQVILAQLVQDAFVEGWIDEVFVGLSLEHSDEDFCRPPPDVHIFTGQVVNHNCNHSGTDGYKETMG